MTFVIIFYFHWLSYYCFNHLHTARINDFKPLSRKHTFCLIRKVDHLAQILSPTEGFLYESADLPVGHLQLLGRRPGTPSWQAPVFCCCCCLFL